MFAGTWLVNCIYICLAHFERRNGLSFRVTLALHLETLDLANAGDDVTIKGWTSGRCELSNVEVGRELYNQAEN